MGELTKKYLFISFFFNPSRVVSCGSAYAPGFYPGLLFFDPYGIILI
jgi:hypothetical protein